MRERLISICFKDFLNSTNSGFITFNNENFSFDNVFFTINSGSIYFLKYYNDFEWFDKRFFVDGVDYSFCIDSNKNKYRIIEVYNVIDLNHRNEQGDSYISFFNHKIYGRKYPFIRNIDFLKSHSLLLLKTLCYIQPLHFLFLTKSLLKYIIIQFLFRLKKNNINF